MTTLNRFASVMEALPLMDPVDPSVDHAIASRRSAFAGPGLPTAYPQA